MNKQKAWHQSGAQWCLLKADILKDWLVVSVSIRGPEYCGKAQSIFPRASMLLGENTDNYKWALDNETFLVISKEIP